MSRGDGRSERLLTCGVCLAEHDESGTLEREHSNGKDEQRDDDFDKRKSTDAHPQTLIRRAYLSITPFIGA